MENNQHNLKIDGMTCSNCALSVERIIQKKGGKDISVNFSTGEAHFKIDGEIGDIKKEINASGFSVLETKQNQKYSSIEKKFAFCAVLTIPLFMHMFAPHDSILNNPYFQLAHVLPILAVGGWHFLKSGFYSLKSGVPNMDVLVTIGSFAAFIYSIVGLIHYGSSHEMHNYLFFVTTATIISLVLLGNVIEARAIKKTTSAIADLQALRPQRAIKVVGVNLIDIGIEDLEVDDFIQINEGDRLPVDGVIVSGEIEVDESMITGESIPAYKKMLTNVTSGTLVVSGNAMVRVKSTYGNSTIDQIISLVKNAQNDKPDIQKLGDKISAIFVPIVLGISALTFITNLFIFDLTFQESMIRSIAVLVISCPCAMGLAAPTAIMVGIGKAAQNGILVKGGNTLQKLAKANMVVFDKTGTLTTGSFEIEKLNYYGEEKERVKQIILSLEGHSNHPIAQSLVKILSKEVGPIYMHDVIEIKGRGIKGTDDDGNLYQLFSRKHAATITSRELSSDLVLFSGTNVIAELWIKDEIKSDAEETISWLKNNGFKTMLLSGDQTQNCDKVAQELYLDDFYAEKNPEEKLNIIKKLTEEYHVIMVGDGINDAPSLATADVGVSFGAATDIAISSADVVLVKQELNALKNAILIGKQSYSVIKQNFFWALFYNVIAIPFAGLGHLKPIIAALSMAFSDVVVIGNAIRLKFKKLN